jgi:hypothetical protein
MTRAVLVLAVLGACVKSGEVQCSDGRLCPPGYQCDEANMRCLSTEQVAACSGREEGADCSVAGAPGACRMGACEALVCGDGLRSVGEACDGTDLGGATCKDAGYYDEAGLACSSFCTFDVTACSGFCGDSMVNGLELCDGAPPPGACQDYGFDAGAVACGGSCGISFDSCARFGWVPEVTTLDHALAFDALSPSDIWVGGDDITGNVVAHFDGNAWSSQPTTGTSPVHAIAAAGPDDAWVILGTIAPVVEHFIGGQWSPVLDLPAATYRDIWAATPTAVFVATHDAGVLAWNGATWQPVGALVDALTRIEGSSSDDLWVVTTAGELRHWNGAGWSPVAVEINVKKVYVTGPDDVWVIGPSTTQTDAYAIGHWNGQQWAITLDSNVNPQIGKQVTAIGAAAANDVWVSSSGGQARHFDGLAWSPVGVPVVSAAFGTFSDIRPFPASTLAITFDGYLYRYRGQMYAKFDTGAAAELVASASLTPATTIAIDNRNMAYRFDGTKWTPETIDTVEPGGSNRALWARAADDIWVGGTGGRLFRYNGTNWVDSGWARSSAASAIVGFAADDVWIFGSGATHYDGVDFTTTTIAGSLNLYRAAASSPSDIWVLGQATTGTAIYRWDGSVWTESQIMDTLSAIVALAPDNVFATGQNRIWHWNGTAWSAQLIPVLDPFIAMAASSPSDVFAMTQGQLVHFDGQQWTFIRVPADVNVANRELTGIEALPGHVDLVYGATFGSVPMRRLIRTRPWNCTATELACSDGVDNDCDARVDGLDSDCP